MTGRGSLPTVDQKHRTYSIEQVSKVGEGWKASLCLCVRMRTCRRDARCVMLRDGRDDVKMGRMSWEGFVDSVCVAGRALHDTQREQLPAQRTLSTVILLVQINACS